VAERTVEYIKFETELLRLTTFAMLGIGGGTIGLIIGILTPLRIVFATVGLLATSSALVALWRQQRAIRARIALLEEAPLWKQ
jgi:hypothetical protein